MKKVVLHLLCCVMVLGMTTFLLVNCQKEPPDSPDAKKNGKLTIALAMQPTSALAILALAKGFLRDQGLQITIKEFPSGKRALNNGLLSREADIAVAADIPIVLSCLQEKRFSIIASLTTTDNVNRIIARRDRGIAKPADLAGKKISTQKASAVHYFLSLFLSEHGIDEKAVEITYQKAEKLPESLAKGSIDAFSMREPYIGMANSRLGENAVIFSMPGEYNQTEFFLASEEMMQNRPDMITRAVKALLRAEAYARNNPEAAKQIVGQRLGSDPAVFAAIWRGLNLRVALEQASLLLLEEQARWAINLGLSDLENIPNILDYFNLTVLESLQPEAITVIR